MGNTIQRVAVLGAGVMGQGIAAHLANAGVPSILFDIAPKEGDDSRGLARAGIKNATKLKPAAFFTKGLAALITPANYDDDAIDNDDGHHEQQQEHPTESRRQRQRQQATTTVRHKPSLADARWRQPAPASNSERKRA